MQLSSCYLFNGLSETQLDNLIAIGNETRIQKGQWLFREDEDAQQMFVLKAGAVELLTTVEDDIELPITILREPGNCFGTSTLVPPHKYSLSARGVEDGTLLTLKKADLEKLMKQDHEVGYAILTNLAKHFLDRLKETRQEIRIHFKTIFRSMHH